MTSESPRTLRGVNALAAHGKYDLPPGEATLGSLPDRPLAGRLERRGSLALGALFVDWESWLVLAVVLLVAGGMGAWIGEREARRAILAGQSPTLAELRARVQRLRRWIIGGAFVVPRGSEGALEEIDGISRELLDLSLTAPQRSIDPKRPHVKPLGVKVSALVAGMPATALKHRSPADPVISRADEIGFSAADESKYRPGRPVEDTNLKIEPPDDPRGAQ